VAQIFALKRRRDAAANWQSNNTTLLEGQLGFQTDGGEGGRPLFKFGDGATAWNSLPFVTRKNNLTAVTAPTVGDDVNSYYSVGSLWSDISDPNNPDVYICTDNSVGAANWQQFGGGGGGTTDHAALTNLTWDVSGHIGTANRFAAFGGAGEAIYVQPTGNATRVVVGTAGSASEIAVWDNNGNVVSVPILASAGGVVTNAQRIESKVFNQDSINALGTSPNYTWDLDGGNIAEITLTEDSVLAAPTNVRATEYTLKVTQDGIGLHSLSFDSAYLFPNGSPVIGQAPNQTTYIKFFSDGTALTGVTITNESILELQSFVFAGSDETSDLAVASDVVTFEMPYRFTVVEVRATVTTPSAGSAIQADIKRNGLSILFTPITIDAGETSSVTAAIPPVLNTGTLQDSDIISADIDVVGSTTAGAGIKFYIIGYFSPVSALFPTQPIEIITSDGTLDGQFYYRIIGGTTFDVGLASTVFNLAIPFSFVVKNESGGGNCGERF